MAISRAKLVRGWCGLTRVNAIEVEDCAVASLAMESGTLAATLGSAKKVSRLRLCVGHVYFESSLSIVGGGDRILTVTAGANRPIARTDHNRAPVGT